MPSHLGMIMRWNWLLDFTRPKTKHESCTKLWIEILSFITQPWVLAFMPHTYTIPQMQPCSSYKCRNGYNVIYYPNNNTTTWQTLAITYASWLDWSASFWDIDDFIIELWRWLNIAALQFSGHPQECFFDVRWKLGAGLQKGHSKGIGVLLENKTQ